MKVLPVVHDDGGRSHRFAMGIGYNAAALRENGHEGVIYNQDHEHHPNET